MGQLTKRLLPEAPVPSSMGELSVTTKTRPVPKVEEAHMICVVFCVKPDCQINPCTAPLAAGLTVIVAPLLNSNWETLPCEPWRMGLVLPPVHTLPVVSVILVRSMLNPNGLVATLLLVIRSFHMSGESWPSLLRSDTV